MAPKQWPITLSSTAVPNPLQTHHPWPPPYSVTPIAQCRSPWLFLHSSAHGFGWGTVCSLIWDSLLSIHCIVMYRDVFKHVSRERTPIRRKYKRDTYVSPRRPTTPIQPPIAIHRDTKNHGYIAISQLRNTYSRYIPQSSPDRNTITNAIQGQIRIVVRNLPRPRRQRGECTASGCLPRLLPTPHSRTIGYLSRRRVIRTAPSGPADQSWASLTVCPLVSSS